MAESTTIPLSDIETFKLKALHWASQFRVVCLLDSNNYLHEKYKSKEWLLAVDAVREIVPRENAFDELKKFRAETNADIFGFFSYDLKNQIEKLTSNNHDGVKFHDSYFFKPRYIFEISGEKMTVNRNYPETFELVEAITNYQLRITNNQEPNSIQLQKRTSRKKYLENVGAIKKQIENGDFYELNYCNEFYAENAEINPVETFLNLNKKAQAPFSCFLKVEEKFLLCTSPERFLKKTENKLIAQPIKGTIKKGNSREENDELKEQLRNDIKERAENVMIVDLMRNDLAKSSCAGSVNVEELFGVYEFTTVNHMISTITSKTGVGAEEIIRNAFPMGSMTGAPKIIVMENIEKYEDAKRGLFSGSIGHISANGDFDFNVVIRSILYNASEKYLSLQTGGAITYDSIPEKEYEEILLKAKGLIGALNASITD